MSLALVVTLLLCGGGAVSAYLLLRNAENGDGAPDPATAVSRFLTAVYTEQDAGRRHEPGVQRGPRPKRDGRQGRRGQGLLRASTTARSFRWDEPAVAGRRTGAGHGLACALTMTTDDEKTAEPAS